MLFRAFQNCFRDVPCFSVLFRACPCFCLLFLIWSFLCSRLLPWFSVLFKTASVFFRAFPCFSKLLSCFSVQVLDCSSFAASVSNLKSPSHVAVAGLPYGARPQRVNPRFYQESAFMLISPGAPLDQRLDRKVSRRVRVSRYSLYLTTLTDREIF